MKIDSIIFDLDGTMWDSTEAVLKAWAAVLEKAKDVERQITREDMESSMGLLINQIGEKFFPYLNEERRRELLKECCAEEKVLLSKEGGILFPNLEKVLCKLSEKYSLFIVSNCECGYIETFLEYHKLASYFKDIECAGNTGLSKGENIKKVIERNELKYPIYVGDTQGDCDGAKLAAIHFVYAAYGFGEVESYDVKINSFEELLTVVEC